MKIFVTEFNKFMTDVWDKEVKEYYSRGLEAFLKIDRIDKKEGAMELRELFDPL